MWKKKRIQRWIETLIAACFYYSGLVRLARWWQRRSSPCLVILNYHRAVGGNLRKHLLYLRRHYRLLHLEEALEELYTADKARPQIRDGRIPLVLTFDDAYQDNYIYGKVLADSLQVPMTIFLIPGYIESGEPFWWMEGSQLVTTARVREVTVEGHTYHLEKEDEREALSTMIDSRVRYAASVVEREEFLSRMREMLASLAMDKEKECEELPVTWLQVQEMAKSGWISFGAHTMHHPILSCLADNNELEYEVGECRVVLERQLGHPLRTFAYPVGQSEHIGESALRAVQKAGYDWAVTTISGFNTAQTAPYLLGRISIDVSEHWLMAAARASGVWDFFSQLYQRLSARCFHLMRPTIIQRLCLQNRDWDSIPGR